MTPATDADPGAPDVEPGRTLEETAPSPQGCPTCGHPYFGPVSSALLDQLILAQDLLARVQGTLEEVVIP
jgi:hypothetical protein